MIKVDLDGKGKMHIDGNMETCFKEWMAITRALYHSVAKYNDLTKASLLFSDALVEACKKGAEDLKAEND